MIKHHSNICNIVHYQCNYDKIVSAHPITEHQFYVYIPRFLPLLQILSEFCSQLMRVQVQWLTSLHILSSIQKPVRNVVLTRILNDCLHFFNLFLWHFTRSSIDIEIFICWQVEWAHIRINTTDLFRISISALRQINVANRLPMPRILVSAIGAGLPPSTLVFKIRKMCWYSSLFTTKLCVLGCLYLIELSLDALITDHFACDEFMNGMVQQLTARVKFWLHRM